MSRFFLIILIFVFAFSISAQNNKENRGEKPFATDISFATIDRKFITAENLTGKIVVLNLWFINCPDCVREIPLLNKLVDEYKDKDVVFLGLATNTRAELQRFLKTNPFKYEIIPDAMEFMLVNFGEKNKGTYSLAFPTHIVIDREGYIVLKTQGIRGIASVKRELQKQFDAVDSK